MHLLLFGAIENFAWERKISALRFQICCWPTESCFLFELCFMCCYTIENIQWIFFAREMPPVCPHLKNWDAALALSINIFYINCLSRSLIQFTLLINPAYQNHCFYALLYMNNSLTSEFWMVPCVWIIYLHCMNMNMCPSVYICHCFHWCVYVLIMFNDRKQ